jgi:hypothetical protein
MCLTVPGNKALLSPNSDTKKETFQMLSHLPRSLNLTFDNIFRGDVSVDSFVMSFGGEQDEPSLSIHQWKFVLRIVHDSGNRTAACTNSKENVQYKKLGILDSNQLSRIEYLDSSSNNPMVFSTGRTQKFTCT